MEPSQQPRPRIVLHLPDEATLAAGLVSASNMRRELGPEPLIEIVVQGGGVRRLCADSELADPIGQSFKAGCVISACGNSLRAQSIDPAQLIAGVGVVPSGAAHVARCQWEHYAYIRL